MGHYRLAVLDVIQSRCVKKGRDWRLELSKEIDFY